MTGSRRRPRCCRPYGHDRPRPASRRPRAVPRRWHRARRRSPSRPRWRALAPNSLLRPPCRGRGAGTRTRDDTGPCSSPLAWRRWSSPSSCCRTTGTSPPVRQPPGPLTSHDSRASRKPTPSASRSEASRPPSPTAGSQGTRPWPRPSMRWRRNHRAWAGRQRHNRPSRWLECSSTVAASRRGSTRTPRTSSNRRKGPCPRQTTTLPAPTAPAPGRRDRGHGPGGPGGPGDQA